MNDSLKSSARTRRVEANMKKLHFLFLLVGGLIITGCPLPIGKGEDQEKQELEVTALPSNGGSVARSPDLPKYETGTVLTLKANPATGYEFTRWEGVPNTEENPTTITMNERKTVTAVFTPTYTLAVAASPSDGGIVDRSYIYNVSGMLDGIRVHSDDETPSKTQYRSGRIVILKAKPTTGYEFSRWEGDVTGSVYRTQITMNGDKAVTAIFTPATTPLIRPSIVSWTYDGGPTVLTVDITNGGIDTLSGLNCSFPDGAPPWLSATLSGSTAPATLTLTLDTSCLPPDRPRESYVCLTSTRISISSAVASNSPQYFSVGVYPKKVEYHSSGPIYTGGGSQFAPKVICAELHRRGMMDESIFEADEAFGKYLRDHQRDVLLGYQLWAKPVVRWMQKSEMFTNIVAKVVTPWSYEMAYRMGARDKGSFVGKILMDVGVPICRILGWAVIWAGNLGSLLGG